MRNYKHIKGFENYLIFPTGKIYSLKRNKYMKLYCNLKGYYRVSLCKSGKVYYKKIARLVAQAFIPNPDNKPEVNHKDGIKANNNVSNLEWATPKENTQHAIRMRLIDLSIPVGVFNYITGKSLSIHPSQYDAARMYGVSQGNISEVLAGKRNHTGGLTFKKI